MSEKSERAQREEKILQFWKENKIFEKTLEKNSPKGDFIFYDGPPFATGLPHYGSLLSSIIKDVIPRYKTMRGFHVRRRWGWDCHGLPIENMVEKELGIKNKKEIEEMGIEKFNKFCRDSVLRFVDEWKVFVDRVGRFVDYDNSYKTMDNSYIESVWWALKEIHNKGLLYEGRKVLLYCPHCETPLAKAEIAMDQSYKNVTEESVYVKFKIVGFPDAYFLAWTTTPWTLPGNVALAVGENIDYVEARVGKEILVLAKERLSILTESYEIIAEHKGKEMVGMEYEPLFEIPAVKNTGKKSWYVTTASFVNTEEGTGIVHTAVIYGEDDYELGLKLDLPMVPLLDSAGHFNNEAPSFIKKEYFKKAEKLVKEDLEKRNLLFKREMHTHSYPHCHRCGTALLYNALSSWFINIQKKKDRMIALNRNINWIPEHLKYGRFLNNVESAPDWTISRNRYWASPLPIWKTSDGEVRVLGSIEELKKLAKKSGNKYFLMRHGEAENNVKRVVSVSLNSSHHLTNLGKEQVETTAKKLLSENIDLIVASPIMRIRETAEIISKILKLESKAIIFDERLREYDAGEFDGKSEDDGLRDYFNSHKMFFERVPGGESFTDTKKRLGEALDDLEKKYQGKNILIISHKVCCWLILAAAERLNSKEAEKLSVYIKNGDFVTFDAPVLPHNENFELDLHRPYIDKVELISENGKPLKRINEVIDGWVESGSMPFAEYHYPMENKSEFLKHFPGDFIAEYIGQTRTWFYYMHAVAVLLFDNISFRNVITTGNILAEDGSKMSKSKGNYTDPMRNLDLFGADALRYYLVSSVIMRAEDVRFVDEEVRQIHNQILNPLWNSFKFYEMYSDKDYSSNPHLSKNILDRWILFRLNELNSLITEGLDAYDTVKATRPIRDFISDFSTWYIRRSRDRFKGENKEDRNFAIATTRHVLLELSKLIAPVMPFIAEDIYTKVKKESDKESVHLESWPSVKKSFSLSSFFASKQNNLIKNMEETRQIVSLALEARSKANIKVRQALQKLEARVGGLSDEYLELIKDEVNVKEIVNKETDGVELDIKLTPELIEEGKVRDIIRHIQDVRKEKGLSPKDLMKFVPKPEDTELFKRNLREIEKATNIKVEI